LLSAVLIIGLVQLDPILRTTGAPLAEKQLTRLCELECLVCHADVSPREAPVHVLR